VERRERLQRRLVWAVVANATKVGVKIEYH
jgi:hypothetical protein